MTFHVTKSSLITLLMTLALVTADGSVNGTCNPLGCSVVCTPTCSSDQTCVLRTMTDCAVCPSSRCISRTALGLPPATTTNSDKNNNGPLIGGIVGGLLGLGLILGLGVYCYFKRSKSSGKLPFMFTASGDASKQTYPFNNNNTNSNYNYNNYNAQNEKPMTPNPAVVAAIAQRTDPTRQSTYITMSDLQSISSSTANTVATSTPQQLQYQEATQPFPTYNNSMSPQHQRLSKLMVENRQSIISNNSSELSEDDQHSIASSHHTPKSVATVQAVQVTRAKPQIMRVNSVKSTGGVHRNGSVRTILTAVEDESTIENPFKDGETVIV